MYYFLACVGRDLARDIIDERTCQNDQCVGTVDIGGGKLVFLVLTMQYFCVSHNS